MVFLHIGYSAYFRITNMIVLFFTKKKIQFGNNYQFLYLLRLTS